MAKSNAEKLEKLREDLKIAFQNAQHSTKVEESEMEILYRFKKLYKKPFFRPYIEAIGQLSISILRSPEQNPNTKRLLDFLARLIQKFSKEETKLRHNNSQLEVRSQETGDEDEDDLVNREDVGEEPYEADKLILKFSEHTRDMRLDVRVNVCRLLKMIFEDLEQIDGLIHNQVQENIGYTTTDKEAKVRAGGLLALASVATNDNTVVNKKKQFIAKYDPEVTVRCCAFKTLTAERTNVDIFMFGINDTSKSIQKLCFARIFKEFNFDWFTQEQICIVFRAALHSNHVSKMLLTSMIPKLLSQLPAGLVSFVGLFNLRNDGDFVCELLRAFYAEFHHKKGIKWLVNDFKDEYLDERAVPNTPKMTAPVILAWESLIDFSKQHNIVVEEEVVDEDGDESLERVQLDLCDLLMPDLNFYCEFLQGFINHHLQQASKTRLLNSDIEDLVGSLRRLIKISEHYTILEDNRTLFIDFFKSIIFRQDVFKLYKKYLKFFVPRMFHGWSVADGEEAFKTVVNVIEELRTVLKIEDDKDDEETDARNRLFVQWSTSIFAGFTRSDFLLELERDGKLLEDIIEFGVKTIDAAVTDFSHASLREALNISHGLVFLFPKIWEQISQFVYHLLPSQDSEDDGRKRNANEPTAMTELNIMAIEIILDVTCLLSPEELELQHAFGNLEDIDELMDLPTDKEKAEFMLESAIMNFFEHEPRNVDKQPMAVRHMTCQYRAYRLSVLAAMRYILAKNFCSLKWLSHILTVYLNNPLIDDHLYASIGLFIEAILPLMKEKKLDPLPFMEAFPVVVSEILKDPQHDAEENAMIFFLNVSTRIETLGVLVIESIEMLENGDSKFWKFNLSLLNEIPIRLLGKSELENLYESVDDFIDSKLPPEPATKKKALKKKTGRRVNHDDSEYEEEPETTVSGSKPILALAHKVLNKAKLALADNPPDASV